MASVALPVQAGEASGTEPTVATEASASDPVTATMRASVLRPRLDANGLPLLGDDGKPIVDDVAVEEASVVPGDVVHYAIEIRNRGEAVEDLGIAFPIPAEMILLPESLASDVPADFGVTTLANPEKTIPVFAANKDAKIVTPEFSVAATEGLSSLSVSIDEVRHETAARITYQLTVR
ncbi:hypothetical protein LAZ40_06865 [Cereibacter sphaeroides]|uniref:hypothetical protein n=1 Tax=Cereibacter sphaeroides TaxID=1063 RepID=UPI001F22DDF7|nr:hypothetical protein [Cereibacter sphaeroides]MCE6958768.1 hypothetical protein [Cereibacter sphaeroides]MCE6973358.1 hypothetical protein [Cereibacter sphaeroides]